MLRETKNWQMFLLCAYRDILCLALSAAGKEEGEQGHPQGERVNLDGGCDWALKATPLCKQADVIHKGVWPWSQNRNHHLEFFFNSPKNVFF